jgi:DNA-directed RNA polymerase alpha subunit
MTSDSVPGYVDSLLNARNQRPRMTCTAALHSASPAELTSGLRSCGARSTDIEVTNPDLLICHLDEGATLNMELTADIGKGYVPAIANRPADAPIGLIPVDALYSPVPPTRSRTPASARSSTMTS